jgi:hypothetical protein
VDRKELEGGDGEMVNCLGHGEHASARGSHVPARAMLVNDRVAALGSRGANDDDGMARVGVRLDVIVWVGVRVDVIVWVGVRVDVIVWVGVMVWVDEIVK